MDLQAIAATRLRELREAKGLSRSALAKAVGTHHNQIQKLETRERKITVEWIAKLAPKLGVEPPEFLAGPKRPETARVGERSTSLIVPEYDVRVSGGAGFVIDRETKKDEWPFSRRYIENELRISTRELVVLEVQGDSMAPTLHTGDRILVDMSDKRVSQPGLFVLWDGDGTVVKRLEVVPASDPPKFNRISDNPLHRAYEVLAEETMVVGRVVWFARRI